VLSRAGRILSQRPAEPLPGYPERGSLFAGHRLQTAWLGASRPYGIRWPHPPELRTFGLLMSSVKDTIDLSRVPRHVAVIMDGNGRWAQEHGQPRVLGHRSGVDAVRTIAEAAAEIGVEWLTLYAFSTENWNRPVLEVNALMDILVDAVTREIETMNRNNIRLNLIGDIDRLPPATANAMRKGLEDTRHNKRM